MVKKEVKERKGGEGSPHLFTCTGAKFGPKKTL